MQRRTKYWIGGILIAAIASAIFFTRAEPIVVEVEVVSRGHVAETVTNTRAGTIKACERARLAPPMGGKIERLLVKKGDSVKRNQLLLELWNDDIRAQLSLAQRDAVAAVARAEQACIASQVARRESDRTASLLDRQLVSAEVA